MSTHRSGMVGQCRSRSPPSASCWRELLQRSPQPRSVAGWAESPRRFPASAFRLSATSWSVSAFGGDDTFAAASASSPDIRLENCTRACVSVSCSPASIASEKLPAGACISAAGVYGRSACVPAVLLCSTTALVNASSRAFSNSVRPGIGGWRRIWKRAQSSILLRMSINRCRQFQREQIRLLAIRQQARLQRDRSQPRPACPRARAQHKIAARSRGFRGAFVALNHPVCQRDVRRHWYIVRPEHKCVKPRARHARRWRPEDQRGRS